MSSQRKFIFQQFSKFSNYPFHYQKRQFHSLEGITREISFKSDTNSSSSSQHQKQNDQKTVPDVFSSSPTKSLLKNYCQDFPKKFKSSGIILDHSFSLPYTLYATNRKENVKYQNLGIVLYQRFYITRPRMCNSFYDMFFSDEKIKLDFKNMMTNEVFLNRPAFEERYLEICKSNLQNPNEFENFKNRHDDLSKGVVSDKDQLTLSYMDLHHYVNDVLNDDIKRSELQQQEQTSSSLTLSSITMSVFNLLELIIGFFAGFAMLYAAYVIFITYEEYKKELKKQDKCNFIGKKVEE